MTIHHAIWSHRFIRVASASNKSATRHRIKKATLPYHSLKLTHHHAPIVPRSRRVGIARHSPGTAREILGTRFSPALLFPKTVLFQIGGGRNQWNSTHQAIGFASTTKQSKILYSVPGDSGEICPFGASSIIPSMPCDSAQ